MNGGHYTSYCKPPQGDVWYQCDNKTVTRLRTPVKMSTAYLLFYDSVHADTWDISLVPTVHLLMVWLRSSGLMSAWYLRREMLGGWGRVLMLFLWCGGGWCGLGGRQWAVEVLWTCPIISRTLLIPYFPKCPPIISHNPSDPIFPKVPSHYFPYPFWSHISQSALLNTYALWFSAGGRCSLLSMGWVSLSSKEMPLTCSASCFRQSVGCGWVHNPQSFPLSGD